MKRAILIVAAAALVSGCNVMADYEDVSASAQYRPLIGRRLAATSELLLHRVSLDPNYEARVGLCSVTPPPGFDVPEVLDRTVLSPQAIFEIVGVRRCVNCGSAERVELVVVSDDVQGCDGATLVVDHQWVGSSVRLLPSGSGTSD